MTLRQVRVAERVDGRGDGRGAAGPPVNVSQLLIPRVAFRGADPNSTNFNFYMKLRVAQPAPLMRRQTQVNASKQSNAVRVRGMLNSLMRDAAAEELTSDYRYKT